jgi:hypothetical protein
MRSLAPAGEEARMLVKGDEVVGMGNAEFEYLFRTLIHYETHEIATMSRVLFVRDDFF